MRHNCWAFLIVGLFVISCGDDEARLPEITLLSHTSIPGNLGTDVWGYIDPQSDREYAIMGDFSDLREGNITIIEVTDPRNPTIASTLFQVIGFDIKTRGQYLYVANSDFQSVTDDSSRIVDISNPEQPTVAGAFQEAHNIFIDDSFLYVSFDMAPGLRIFDIGSDPTKPEMVWEASNTAGSHDVAVIRNRLYDFHGTDATYIYDITDPVDPRLLGEVRSEGTFHHSGWVTEDDDYLFICDETAPDPLPDVTIWDIRDPGNPLMVGEISDSTARVHNLYIVNDLAYVSYYAAGFRIYDISNPREPLMLDQFNTNLNGGDGIGNGFLGAFGVYPFSPSGNIFVSDMDNGLFVFEYR